jgi:hypothetical protein
LQVFITDQPDPDLAGLAVRHRHHARVEDRIRAAKATGLRKLPFDRWRGNAVWLQLVLLALDLVAWTQALLGDGHLAVAEPKTLRYRRWHVAGRIGRHARRLRLRRQRSWPWRPTRSAPSPACTACRCAADPGATPTVHHPARPVSLPRPPRSPKMVVPLQIGLPEPHRSTERDRRPLPGWTRADSKQPPSLMKS